ncbi:MAG: hypothetical protein HOM11_10740 [Methylococcales bacterium]|jgi:hypothetical protein|nr:hypothetical protein [Methylococcales bacterium]MBT7444478.1 hypothetical protein [Methylococcales bacterium]
MNDIERLKLFGKALSQNADIITQLCDDNIGDVFVDEPQSHWPFLLQHDIIYGDNISGFVAANLLYDIHDTLTQVSRRISHIPDIQDWMESMQHSVESYKRQKGLMDQTQQAEALKRKADISRMTTLLIGGLREEVQELEHLVENQFGYVSSLFEKQKENEFFLSKAKRTLDKLTAINAEWSLRLAGDDTYLFALLHTKLINEMEHFRNRLTTIVSQMRKILWVLRDTNRLTRKIRTLSQHIKQHGMPELDIPISTLSHSAFNHIQPQQHTAHIDTLNDSDQSWLKKLVKRLKPRKTTQNTLPTEHANPNVVETDHGQIHIPVHLFMTHYKPFMLSAKNQAQSAKAYWEKHGIAEYDVDLWLWWLHKKVSADAQKPDIPYQLNIQEIAKIEGDFTGNKLIFDVMVTALLPE